MEFTFHSVVAARNSIRRQRDRWLDCLHSCDRLVAPSVGPFTQSGSKVIGCNDEEARTCLSLAAQAKE